MKSLALQNKVVESTEDGSRIADLGLPSMLRIEADKVLTGLSPGEARQLIPLLELIGQVVWVVNCTDWSLPNLHTTPVGAIEHRLKHQLKKRNHKTRYPIHTVIVFGHNTSSGIDVIAKLMASFDMYAYDVLPYNFDLPGFAYTPSPRTIAMREESYS